MNGRLRDAEEERAGTPTTNATATAILILLLVLVLVVLVLVLVLSVVGVAANGTTRSVQKGDTSTAKIASKA